MITLLEIKNQIGKYLYLTDTDVVDVVMAFVVANRIPGDSISLYIVGPSSSAKTEMIECISKNPHVEEISIITPHALISGYKEKAKDNEDHSVLTRLQKEDRNILAFKDFTTIISMRREDRSQFMSHLREMADGKISGLYGNRPPIRLKAKFGVIAACTNAIDEFVAGNAILGERFLKYRILAEMTGEIARAAVKHITDKDALRDETSSLVKIFLDQFEVMFQTIPEIDDACEHKIIDLCILGAHLRSPIIRDEKGIQVSEVDHEGPGRLVSSVAKLARSLAIVRGMEFADLSLYPILKKIVKDTMPPYRLRIVEMMYEAGGVICETDICKRLNISRPTVSRYCSDLASISFCKRDPTPRQKTYISLTDRYITLIENSEIFVIDKI